MTTVTFVVVCSACMSVLCIRKRRRLPGLIVCVCVCVCVSVSVPVSVCVCVCVAFVLHLFILCLQ